MESKEEEEHEEKMCHAAFVEAARWGDLEMVEAMLQGDHPVDMDCRYCPFYAGDMMALYMAWEHGKLAMVQALLQAGAGLKEKCDEWTALHVACYYNQNTEVIEELLKAGADVNMTNGMGDTPLLTLECDPLLREPVNECQLQIMHVLLEAKCDINYSIKGEMAMSLAVYRDLHEIVQLLMLYGTPISTDAFFCCVWHNNRDAVVFALEHGIDVNTIDAEGNTALHHAAALRHIDLVQLLLDHNADVSLLDHRNKHTAPSIK